MSEKEKSKCRKGKNLNVRKENSKCRKEKIKM